MHIFQQQAFDARNSGRHAVLLQQCVQCFNN
jgi:hypothetical protein